MLQGNSTQLMQMQNLDLHQAADTPIKYSGKVLSFHENRRSTNLVCREQHASCGRSVALLVVMYILYIEASAHSRVDRPDLFHLFFFTNNKRRLCSLDNYCECYYRTNLLSRRQREIPIYTCWALFRQSLWRRY